MKKILWILLLVQMLFAIGIKELNSDDTVETFIEKMQKHVYKITVPKDRSLHVELSNLDADIDLYVRAKDIPSIRVNDCFSSNGNNADESCVLNNSTEESDYFILVYGYEEGHYKLNIFDGELEKISILPKEGIKGEVLEGGTNDYKFFAKKGERVTVQLYELTADADLRVKVGRKATRHRFDCKSRNGGIKEDSCTLRLEEDDWVYIQVDGYRHAEYKLKVKYSIIDDEFLKNVLIDEDNPERGVYVKYSKKQERAYIFVDQESKYFLKHKGITVVDYRDINNPIIVANNPRVYLSPSDIYLTTNGEILTFTYTDTHQYLASVNLSTLALVDNIRITISGMNYWAEYKRSATNLDLFYTIHATPEKGLYHYYHVSGSGEITPINGIHAGGLDSYFIWEQGSIDDDKYFITYLEEYASGSTQYLKFIKKIYNVSSLPDMPLIDTIITEEERPI